MALGTFPLQVVFTAADRGLLATVGRVDSAFSRVGAKIAGVGRNLTFGVTAPLVAAGGLALRSAAQLEGQLIRSSVVARATREEYAALEGQALDLGAASIFSATQVAGAQTKLALAGYRVNQILAATPGVVATAAAAFTDAESAAGILTEVLKGYGLEAGESIFVANVLAGAATRAKVTIEGLGEAFSYAGGLASQQRQPFTETAALLAVVGERGFEGSRGGRAYAAAVAGILKVTPDAAKAFTELGIARDQVLDDRGNLRSFVGLLELLRSRGASSGQVLRIFGQEAGRAVLQAVEHVPEIRDLARRLGDDDQQGIGRAAEIAAARMGGATGALENLGGALETLQIRFVQRSGLFEEWTKLVRGLTGVVERLGDTSPGTLRLVANLGLAAAVAGPLIFTVGQLTVAFGGLWSVLRYLRGPVSWLVVTGLPGLARGLLGVLPFLLTNPFGQVLLVVGALGSLAAVIYTRWDDLRGFLGRTWAAIAEGAESVADRVARAAERVVGGGHSTLVQDAVLGLGGVGPPRRGTNLSRVVLGGDAAAVAARRAEFSRSGPLAAPSSTVRIELPNLPAGSRVSRYDYAGGAPVELDAGVSLAGVGAGG